MLYLLPKFLDKQYMKLTTILQNLIPLPKPLQAFNVDGTLNEEGTITHYVSVDILINDQPMIIELELDRVPLF